MSRRERRIFYHNGEATALFEQLPEHTMVCNAQSNFGTEGLREVPGLFVMNLSSLPNIFIHKMHAVFHVVGRIMSSAE